MVPPATPPPATPPGPAAPPFFHADADRSARVAVIAEIGVNHDGDPRQAARLIDAAADAGAHAVKFQRFRPAALLADDAPLAAYQRRAAADARSLLAPLTLPDAAWPALRQHARRRNVAFVVTPFGVDDARALAGLDVDAVKIASPDAVNPPLLRAAAVLARPLWISTGACEPHELDEAAALAAGGGPGHRPAGALLQCVSAYPTADEHTALGGVAALRARFGDLRVGYSDHTAAEDTGALAVAAGACLLEKHLTHDPAAPGPDHAASLAPDAFARYVTAAVAAATRVGPVRKRVQTPEVDVRRVARQSLCPVRDLPAGHRLSAADLTTRRPGTGVPAAGFDAAVGRRLARPVRGGHPLRPQDLA